MATAKRALALGMDVRFYDPFIADGYDKAVGVKRVESLESLMNDSYVLSLHCPLTEQTRKNDQPRIDPLDARRKLFGQYGSR